MYFRDVFKQLWNGEEIRENRCVLGMIYDKVGFFFLLEFHREKIKEFQERSKKNRGKYF